MIRLHYCYFKIYNITCSCTAFQVGKTKFCGKKVLHFHEKYKIPLKELEENTERM